MWQMTAVRALRASRNDAAKLKADGDKLAGSTGRSRNPQARRR